MKMAYFSICCVLLLPCLVAGKSKAVSGPYIITLAEAGPCKEFKPHRPFEKVPSLKFYCQLYNTTEKINLLRGYLHVIKDKVIFKVNLNSYYIENGKRQLGFQLSNVDCRTLIVATLSTMFGIGFDKKTCSIAKGNYTFENIDYNTIDHLWMTTREYGEMVYRVEGFFGSLTYFCWESKTVVKPLK